MARDISELTSLLTILGRICQARALAVWTPIDGQLQLVADWRLEHSLVEWLRRTWVDVETKLHAGQRLTLAVDVTLHPLLARDGGLVGLVQHVGPLPSAGARRDYLDETLLSIARILTQDRPAGMQAHRMLALAPFDLRASHDTFNRQAYGAWLERCGWDITQAAAILGITRQALYDRLDGLGLARLTSREPVDEPEG